MEKKGTVLFHKYEIGRLLGQGTFAKVYHARHIVSGKSVAIKIVYKEKVLRVGMINQIKREISVMRLVKHPNVVQLYEVMASKTKIYFAMEYVKGGELFNKISKGKLKEDQARNYFQQLISAIDYCHSRGVYHRDLKPENLLLDENGNLKITDFGLSALGDSRRQDGLLHTTCGTPAYVAPEVINKRGYDGAKADIWSCGVVLYVLLAGYLPFKDTNLMELYRKISNGDFKFPNWFPSDVRKLLCQILDACPSSRITVSKLKENKWFRQGFKNLDAPNEDGLDDSPPTTPKDVRNVFNDFNFEGNNGSYNNKIDEEEEGEENGTSKYNSKNNNKNNNDTNNSNHSVVAMKPTSLNAFDIISLSPGFDLSGLFERADNLRPKPEAWFTTSEPPSTIVSKFEEIAKTNNKFKIDNKDGIMKLESNKQGRKGLLKIQAEIFEVASMLHVIEVKKSSGDTLEYNDFCNQDLRPDGEPARQGAVARYGDPARCGGRLMAGIRERWLNDRMGLGVSV
ncbi:CBL-interacting protein kinase 5 [Bienertia sinuspersici]